MGKKLFSGLFGAVLAFALVAMALVAQVNTKTASADGGHVHCVCGGNCDVITNAEAEGHAAAVAAHTCNATQVWEEWNGSLGTLTALPANSEKWYYISDSAAATINWGSQYTFAQGVKLHICLNGHTIQRTTANATGSLKYFLIGYNGGACVLDICDCKGTGHLAYQAGKLHSDNYSFIQNYRKDENTTTVTSIYGGTIDQATCFKLDGSSNPSLSNGAMTVGLGQTLNMFGGTFNGAKMQKSSTDTGAKGYGGAVAVTAGGVMNMYGGTIQNGSAIDGGNITSGGNGVINMYGGTVKDGKASANGGNFQLYCSSGDKKQVTLNLYGGTISGGTAANGGNISCYGGIFHQYGGLVTGGAATSAGGNVSTVWITSDCVGKVYMDGGTISNGTAKAGGNVGANGNGMVFIMNDGLVTGGTITNTEFTGAYTSKSNYTNDKRGYGGNIFIQGNGYFEMNGGEVSNGTCIASETGIACGGNIGMISWRNSSEQQLTGSIVINGGVIKNGKITYTGTTPTKMHLNGGNICAGGAISSALDGSGALKIYGGTITNDLTTDGSGERLYGVFYSGTANLYPRGANIYVPYGVTLTAKATKANIEISNGYVKSTKWAPGGNIAIYGNATFEGTDDYTCVIKNGTGPSSVDGANVYKTSNDKTASFKNVTIEGGYATGGTGGFCTEGGTTNFTNCTFKDNSANGAGGSIYTKGAGLSTVTLTDCIVSGGISKTSVGGNIYISGNTTFKLINSTVTGGTSLLSNGGNIYSSTQTENSVVYRPTVLIQNSTISDGVANLSGGNIFTQGVTSFVIDNSTVKDGQAKCIKDGAYNSGNGGGNMFVSSENTVQLINGTVFEGGIAEAKGGSIYVNQFSNAILEMTDSTIRGGLAKKDCGGNIACCGIVKATNSTIEDGTATGGGNVWINISGSVDDTLTNMFGYFIMNGGTIKNGRVRTSAGVYGTGNGCNINLNGGYVAKAWRNPGHFIMNGGSVVLDEGTFTGIDGKTYTIGSTISNGANISNQGHVVITDGTVSGGTTTASGAAIYIAATPTTTGIAADQQAWLKMTNGTVSGGTSYSGGNIYVGARSELSLNGTTVSDGVASATVGGNILTEGTTTITDATIKDGSAPTATNGIGGNIYSKGTITLTNSTVTGGYAKANAGNFRAQGGTVTIVSGTFSDGSCDVVGEARNCFFVSSNVTIQGGTFLHDNDAEVNVWIHKNCTAASVTGGYFQGQIKTSGNYFQNAFTGGYFTLKPATTQLAEGYVAAQCNVTEGGIAYKYQVGEGYILTVGSESTTGTKNVALVSIANDGAVLKDGSIFLNAALGTNGYQFVKWIKETAPDVTVSTNPNFELTNVAEDANYIAVYSFGEANLKVRIATTVGTLKVNGTDTALTDGVYTSDAVAPGTVFTVTGPATILGWQNGIGKKVADGVSYEFTVYTDTVVEEILGSDSQTMVMFYSDANQLVKTILTSTAITESDIPAVPVRIGRTGGAWDKTLAEINAAIADATVTSIAVTAPASSYTISKIYDKDLGESTDPQIQMTVKEVTATGETATLTFGAQRKIPEGYTVVEQGILVSSLTKIVNDDSDSIKQAMSLEGASNGLSSKVVSSSKDLTGITMLNVKNIGSGITIFARGYVVLQAEGSTEVTVVYTDIARGTSTAITIE